MSLLMSEPTPQPSQPVKRKRGRPPKANKPEDAFPTFTMQLQSSPLSGSPNAERTSSQVVRIGEPDSFTPVMKVMPSPHRKKRRKSSHFSSPLDPPRFPSIEELSTPIVKPGIASSGSNKLHSRGLDKLSIMVNNVTNVAAHLNTPPDSVLRPGFSLSSGDLSESLKEKSCLPEAQVRRHKHSSGSPHLFEKDTGYHMHNSTPISEPISESAWGSALPTSAHDDLDLFGFDLVIDENGQAALADRSGVSFSNDLYFPSTTTEQNHKYTGHDSHFSSISGPHGDDFRGVEQRTHSLPEIRSTNNATSRVGEDLASENYRMAGFPLGISPSVEGTAVHEVFDPSCSPEFDSSMYHMVEMHAQNFKRLRHSSDHFGGNLTDLMAQPLKTHDPFDRFSVDTQNLVIDANCSDVHVESADARAALRKVFRRG